MKSVLILVVLLEIIYIVKALIDINALVLRIIKNKEVSQIPNELEKNYQFIKGLY